eukprot:COSAG01_NODE_69937_length_260_cov_0.590062_1_plen_75_part_01
MIQILRFHVPRGYNLDLGYGDRSEPNLEYTTACDYPYVLAMERGERSLHEVCARERIAGYEFSTVTSIFTRIVNC